MKVFIDVGGTELKVAAVNEEGKIVGNIRHFDADSGAGCEEIFDNMANVIKSVIKEIKEMPTSIGMAFPGPFDYENGVCLIKGLGKYGNIYNKSVPDEIKKRIPELKEKPFLFVHDVEAFAIGAYCYGESKGRGKTMFVCIGTGTGTAFIKDGKVLKNCEDGAPKDGWIYEAPYKDGKIDEYLSVRGLKRVAKEVTGDELTGLEIYNLCKEGDPKGFEVYDRFGEDVCAALSKYINDFNPNVLVFGGQISKSFEFFGKGVEKLCKEKGIRIEIIHNTSSMTVKGLYNAEKSKRKGK